MSRDDDIECPFCHGVAPLAMYVMSEEARRTFTILVGMSVPLGQRVIRYLTLFTPPKTRLTQGKQLKLIEQILPDLRRQAITVNRVEWPAPESRWSQAFERIFSMADAQRLDLPMTSHRYLYSTIQDLANKAMEQAEVQAEQDKRTAPQRGTVQVRGQAMSIGEGLQVMYGGKDPALADMAERGRQAAKPSDEIRQRIAQITGKGNQG